MLVSAPRSSCGALTHVHISYMRLSNKSRMLIQSAGQSEEMSVCVFTNDVSISLSNAIQFFPLSSLDCPVSFLNITTHLFFFGPRVSSYLRDDERHTRGEVKSCPVIQHEYCICYCEQMMLPVIRK